MLGKTKKLRFSKNKAEMKQLQKSDKTKFFELQLFFKGS